MSLDRFFDLRNAGKVQRCHTFSHHGSYSVAEHCYQSLHLIFTFHPDPSVDLLRAVAYHDSAELMLGDLPAPAKWRFGQLKAAYEDAEATINMELGVQGMLSSWDHVWMEAVDILEFALWCLDQWNMGNREVLSRVKTCQEIFEDENVELFPNELLPLKSATYARIMEIV